MMKFERGTLNKREKFWLYHSAFSVHPFLLCASVSLWLILKRVLSSLVLTLSIGGVLSIHAQTVPRPSESKDEIQNGQQSSASPGSKQDDLGDDVIRVDTNLVTVPVTVMDREGRFVTDLRRDDFRVYEDGVEQQIAFFAPVEQPFTVVLLLDTSPSTKFKLKDIKESAIAFIDQLRPEDRAVGVTFNSELHVLNRMMRDRDGLRKAIRNISTAPGTYLYATVDVMLNRLFRRIPGRKALVIFTDGVDNLLILQPDKRRRATFKSNLRDAEESGVIIYPIQYNTLGEMLQTQEYDPESLLKDYRVASDYLKSLANKTGGRLYQADTQETLRQAFASIAEDLRRQYSLGYYPKRGSVPGQQVRKIKISVNRANVAVHAKDSYNSNPPEAGSDKKPDK
jgi:Ca-activated chloride channel family protein